MNRGLATLAAMALLASISAGTAVAGPPTTLRSEQTGIRCELSTPLGYASVYVETSDGGSYASVLVWAPDADPFEDLPVITTASSSTSYSASLLVAEVELITADDIGTRVGSASVVATLTPDGPLQDFGSREIRDGNLLVRQSSSLQLYTVSGTLAISLLSGGATTVDLENCGASTFTSNYFGTNPDAWVYGEEQVYVGCYWATDVGEISLLAVSEERQTLSQVVIVTDGTVLLGLTMPELSGTSYEALHELFDLSVGAYVGTAAASATLASTGERIAEHEWQSPHRIIQTGERLGVSGTLSLEVHGDVLELTMNDVACGGGDIRYLVQEKR